MMPRRGVRACISGAVAMLLAGCGGGGDTAGPSTTGPRHTDAPLRAGVVVSAPVPATPAIVAARSAELARIGATVVYVSMRPGTVAGGTSARITDFKSGVSLTIPVVDGGFDPLSIPGTVGDTVSVLVSGSTGGTVQAYIAIEATTPPVIVRSDPPNGQTDVPLNTNIVIVFSEPILAASVSTSSIVVTVAGTRIAGSLQFVAGSNVKVLFVPDVPLSTSTEYVVTVTGGVIGQTGQPVSPFTVTFLTVPPPPVPITLATISVNIHSCGLTPAGAAYCWGQNIWGELGDMTTTDRHVAVPVSGGVTFASISAGTSHTCALTTAGIAYCWGYNGRGGLGDGSLTSRAFPAPVVGGLQFTSISANAATTCGVSTSGDAYCWGYSGGGMVGGGTAANCPDDNCTVPVKVAGGLTFSSVSINGYSVCGTTRTGAGFCWGANGYGELGSGSASGPEQCPAVLPYGSFTTIPCSRSPVPVAGGLTFTQLIAGGFFTCGLVDGGAAYCWGMNNGGQFGNGTFDGIQPHATPIPAAGLLRFRELRPGNQRICGIALSGETFCWGYNSNGEIGAPPGGCGGICRSAIPNLVLGGLAFTTVSVGTTTACALTAAGEAYCWGQNLRGGLGNDSLTDSYMPVRVLGRQ